MFTRLSGRRLGSVRKLVVSGLGCACQKKTLGQDDDDLNFGIPSGLIQGGNIANVTAPVDYPASIASGSVYVPASQNVSDDLPSYATSPAAVSQYSSVFNNPQSSPLSFGTLATPSLVTLNTIGSSVGGLALTDTEWLLIGGGFLAILLFTSMGSGGGKKRR